MADDPVGARMAELRISLVGGTPDECYQAGRALWDAVNAVLAPHSPRSDRVLGSSCFNHRNKLNTMVPVPGCTECVQDRQREVCPECRDQFGDPVLFQDCRARAAVLAALTGKGNADG